jgi:hypothetical protein
VREEKFRQGGRPALVQRFIVALADLLAKDLGGVGQKDLAVGVGSETFLTEPRSVLASVLEHLADARDDEPCPGGFLFDVCHTGNVLRCEQRPQPPGLPSVFLPKFPRGLPANLTPSSDASSVNGATGSYPKFFAACSQSCSQGSFPCMKNFEGRF